MNSYENLSSEEEDASLIFTPEGREKLFGFDKERNEKKKKTKSKSKKSKKGSKKSSKSKKSKGSKKSKTSKKSKGSRRSKKKKNGKKKKADVFKAKISCETFFTDPILCTYRLENSDSSANCGFALVSVEKLLVLLQKLEYNPLVIKIMKINNLPVDVLQKEGWVRFFALLILYLLKF